MTDYTPSTDEVRDAYAGDGPDQAIGGAQFDRWLAQVKRDASAEAAWDKGREHGFNEGRDYFVFGYGCGPDTWDCDCENPYRKENSD